ncbi:uridine phosphorylase [Clostridia bacterium]|nr:uridine phosphorylase [Clostridia bacterium]
MDGAKVNVMSVGIGGPSMAIGVEELVKLGVKTFIRVGTSGGIDLDVKAGDLVIPTAAIRQEGTTKEYLPEFFPAAADFSVVTALRRAVDSAKLSRHIGVVQSKDSFYGELEPERMPMRERLTELWEIYKRTGVLVSEMECAALFCLGSVLRVRTGALLLCIWNEERKKAYGDASEFHDASRMYAAAVGALRSLIEDDKGR